MSQVYHHIDIDNNYQKYLHFSWKIDGKIIYFMFIVLPFSLSSVPLILPKLCLCAKKEGIKICAYIDGFGSPSPPVKNSWTQCGFIINFEKSVWQLQKELIWLGIIYK